MRAKQDQSGYAESFREHAAVRNHHDGDDARQGDPVARESVVLIVSTAWVAEGLVRTGISWPPALPLVLRVFHVKRAFGTAPGKPLERSMTRRLERSRSISTRDEADLPAL